MPKLTNIKQSATKTVLLFGPPKSGKTLVAGKLAESPDCEEVIYLGGENGHDTLFQLSPEAQAKINVIAVPDTPQLPMFIETVLKVLKLAPVDICVEHGKGGCPICKAKGLPMETICLKDFEFKTNKLVIIDSMTQLKNSALNVITKGKGDDYKPDWDDWARLGKVMDAVLSPIQAARYNIVVISHEDEVEMEDGKSKLVAVAGTRNFSRNSAKYFSDVVHAEIKNKSHMLASSTTYSPSVLVGSRSNVKLEGDKDPSLKAIFGWK